MNIIVILGRNGKVASMLGNALAELGHDFVALPWKATTQQTPAISDGGIKSQWLDEKLKKYSDIIFVDCLWDSNDPFAEQRMHSLIESEVHLCYPNAKYVLISTFEPDISSRSSYRQSKASTEALLLSRKSTILRIGLIQESYIAIGSKQGFIGLRPIGCRPIMVPITYARDISIHLVQLHDRVSSHETLIHRCYSEYVRIGFNFKHGFRIGYSRSELRLVLPLPSINMMMLLLRWTRLAISPTCRKNLRGGLIALIDRLHSLLEQQKLISQLTDKS